MDRRSIEMRESESSDGALLGEWLESRREGAFRMLVARYAGLVHGAAMRVCSDEAMAAEAAQMTFILLAGKARLLTGRRSLAGWLHLTAVMQVRNLVKRSRREFRKRRELHTAMNDEAHEGEKWDEMKPVLDDALESLGEKDREVILLHYYRSLNFREVGEMLGIASEAARKRIERATEKLRGKLAVRGVDAGGSLSSVMLAGFSVDAGMAGLPVKLMAAKAVAAGTASGAGPVVAATVFMKASSLVPPVLALVAAGFWIVPKREAVAAVEKKFISLEREVGHAMSGMRVDRDRGANPRRKTGGGISGKRQIDWEAIAIADAEEANSGKTRSFVGIERMMFDHRLKRMTGEELMEELKRIGELPLSEEAKDKLRNQLCYILAKRDPAFALNHLEQWLGDGKRVGFALKSYAATNPDEAVAWLDRQIAEGRLEVKRLDGRNWDRDRFEGALIQAGLVGYPEKIAARLRTMNEKDRMVVLAAMPPRLPNEQQVAYAKLVRDVIDEPEKQARIIARLGLVLNEDFGWVDAYLKRIDATEQEMAETHTYAARYSLMNTANNRKLTEVELGKSWKWIGERMPSERGHLVGQALGEAWSESGPTGFEDVAKLVVQFNGLGEDDEVLVAFLKSRWTVTKKAKAREMAALISDEGVRAEVLEGLK